MEGNNKSRAAGEMTLSGNPSKGQRSLRNAFKAFRKRGILVLASFLIVFLALCGFHYFRSGHTASTVLSLDYEEASKGLTPNGMRFNIFEIRSSEVMERLIGYAGLEGKITPEELSECVSVEATHDQSISGSVNYISTSFIVSFTNDGVIDQISAEDMLSLLCKAYREYFVEHYGFNHSILSFDVDELKFNDEYLMAADLLELKCGQLEKYAQLRSRESKNYQDPETGATFASLEQRLNSFYTYDLGKLRSYIIENGIANDRAGLVSMLDYKIRMDSLARDKIMAAYEEDNNGIGMYDAAMSAVVMIPTQDQNMQYYMSRTKTGMDNMVSHAQAQLAGTAELGEQIEYNSYLTQKLETNTPDRAKVEKADAMIRELTAELDGIASEIQKADSVYLSTKGRNFIGFSEANIGLAERIGLLPSLLCAVLVTIAAVLCVFLRSLVSDKEVKG